MPEGVLLTSFNNRDADKKNWLEATDDLCVEDGVLRH
jgi:hypothetical protein